MSLYLGPQYAFVGIPEDDEGVWERAQELTAWLNDPANQVAHGDKLEVSRVCKENQYGFAVGLKLSRFSACVYESDIFSDDELVRPFETSAFGLVENAADALKAALDQLIAAHPYLQGVEWDDKPQRFFSVTT